MENVFKFMECKPNSDQAIINCLVLLASIDNEMDIEEENFIKELCKEYEIQDYNIQSVFEAFSSYGFDYERLIDDVLNNITDFDTQKKTLGLLNDLALADDRIDDEEIKLIDRAANTWDLKKLNSNIVFDENQNKIINSNSSDRLLIIAPPGCGKTAVACARVAELIKQGTRSHNIYLLSFTRTAVKELKDRIDDYFDDEKDLLGLKISTIDSQSWNLRYGFTEEDVKNLFGSYENNISEILNEIKNKNKLLIDHFSNLEHLIIDEAQDLVGIRSEFILSILNIIPKTCCVTIFADPIQSIYDFNENEEEKEQKVDFIDKLNNLFSYKTVKLTNIYRTNAKNLITLITDLRDLIQENNKFDNDMLNDFKDKIYTLSNFDINKQFNPDEFNKFYQDGLILYRRRAEVLFAYHKACLEGIQFRLRLGNMPKSVFSWIARIFKNTENVKINYEIFESLSLKNLNKSDKLTVDKKIKKYWKILLNIAKQGELLNLDKLKENISRSSPPIEICYPELTKKGPILGTIHASKGREADTVVLLLNNNIEGNYRDNLRDEAKIGYVGGTRAKNKLVTGHGYVQSKFSTNLKHYYGQDRCIWPNRNGRGSKYEIGVMGDVDTLSLVSREFHENDIHVKNLQSQLWGIHDSLLLPIRLEAILNDDETNYNIYFPKNTKIEFNNKISKFNNKYLIGKFSNRFFSDLQKYPKKFRLSFSLPDRIDDIFLVGITSNCLVSNDQNLNLLHSPYSESGFWLSPIIRGFPTV